MPTVSQPYGGRMSPSHPADAHGTLPKPGSLLGTVNKSDVYGIGGLPLAADRQPRER